MTGQMGRPDGTRATARLSRRTAKTNGTAVVEAKWDTNRNLTVVSDARCSLALCERPCAMFE